MTTSTSLRTSSAQRSGIRYPRAARALLALGALLSIVTALVAILDMESLGVLADHVRSSYPEYSQAEVDDAVGAYGAYLFIVAGLSLVGWAIAYVAVARERRWIRYVSPVFLLLGAVFAATVLLITEANGVRAFPALHGWLGVLPPVAGLAATVALWRGGSGSRQ